MNFNGRMNRHTLFKEKLYCKKNRRESFFPSDPDEEMSWKKIPIPGHDPDIGYHDPDRCNLDKQDMQDKNSGLADEMRRNGLS